MLLHLFQAAVLGAVQGITEFLPVSSTAHLILVEHFFRLDPAVYGLSFDMFTNIGTTAALLFFYKKDLWELFKKIRIPSQNRPLNDEEKVPWWILGVTAVVGVIGYLLEDVIATTLRTLPVIASSLVVVGIIMLMAEKHSEKIKRESRLTVGRAYLVGLAQAVAFIPGVSRSGITISTGLFAGLDRKSAARYSFLLSVPITSAAILKRMVTFATDNATSGISVQVALFYGIGALVAGIVGYYALAFLISYLSRASLAVFAYYRFILAAGIVLFFILS